MDTWSVLWMRFNLNNIFFFGGWGDKSIIKFPVPVPKFLKYPITNDNMITKSRFVSKIMFYIKDNCWLFFIYAEKVYDNKIRRCYMLICNFPPKSKRFRCKQLWRNLITKSQHQYRKQNVWNGLDSSNCQDAITNYITTKYRLNRTRSSENFLINQLCCS